MRSDREDHPPVPGGYTGLDPRRWECVNQYGAVVYDGLYENEARLIAEQHGLRPRRA